MKNIILILIILTVIVTSTKAQAKYATYWLAPTMTENMAEKLSRDSLLIIDYENLVNNHKTIEEIKRLNPRIKILIYSNSMETWDKGMNDRPWVNNLRTQMPAAFFLKQANGKPVVFWPGMTMMNMSSNCPRVNGKNYNEYYAEWLLENPLSDPLADGSFSDNGTSSASFINRLIDSDNNHLADSPSALDVAWKTGMTEFLKLIRKAKGKDFIIVTNKGEKGFFFLTNGAMFEKFPNNYLGSTRAGGWYQCMENARHAGPYAIFQVDYKNLEFGLASSLLLDNVYIAAGHNMPVPETFRIATGKPLGNMYKKGSLYCRDYELVRVEVSPENKTGRLIQKPISKTAPKATKP